MSYYNSIVASVQAHSKLPSFFARSTNRAQDIELTWDGTKYTATLTDTNNVLSDYTFAASNPSIRFSVNGNQLTITTDKAPDGPVAITASKNNSQRRGIVTWTDGHIGPDSTLQDLVTYAPSVTDPIKGYMNIKVSYGSVKIVKTAEDGKIAGIRFTITGNGVNETVQTNNTGVIQIDNLAPGVYTLSEQSFNEYAPQESRQVTVVSGQTATVTFNNTLRRGDMVVTKTAEDGLVEGVKFHLYGTSLSGAPVDEYAVTDRTGRAYFRNVLIGTGYTLEEMDVPVRYVVPDSQSVYLKSAGSYEAARKSERDHLVCDENGFAQTKDLPYGVYTVHQVSGWEGQELLADFDVYIAKDGQTYRYLANNALFESYIKIVKVDAETGKTIPYAGAGFQIFRPDGSKVSQTFTYPTMTTIDTFYTNSEGYLITPEPLEYGTGYYLVEVAAPFGYVLDSAPVYFDVTEDNAIKDDGLIVVEVTKANMAQKGVIKINKTGEVFSTVTENSGIYQPVYEVQGLPGAVFEITAAEDIYTPDGTLRYSAGQVVDTVSSDKTGSAVSKALYLGKFKIREVTAPTGMIASKEIHSVELTYAGQEVKITETASNIYNERQKIAVTLEKAIEQNELFGIGMNGEITAVTFGLYATEKLTAADGTVIPADGLIEIVSIDEKGQGAVGSDLPLGNYYLKEQATDNHYILSDEKYPVVFESAGQDTDLVEIKANNGTSIGNRPDDRYLRRGRQFPL